MPLCSKARRREDILAGRFPLANAFPCPLPISVALWRSQHLFDRLVEGLALELLSMTPEVSGLDGLRDIAPGLLLDRIGDAGSAGLTDAELVLVCILLDQRLEFVELLLGELFGAVQRLFDLLRHVVANVLAASLLERCGHPIGEGDADGDHGVVSDVEDLAFDSKLCHLFSPFGDRDWSRVM
jgi:hypothetical protein